MDESFLHLHAPEKFNVEMGSGIAQPCSPEIFWEMLYLHKTGTIQNVSVMAKQKVPTGVSCWPLGFPLLLLSFLTHKGLYIQRCYGYSCLYIEGCFFDWMNLLSMKEPRVCSPTFQVHIPSSRKRAKLVKHLGFRVYIRTILHIM